jgi:hypothetical protein
MLLDYLTLLRVVMIGGGEGNGGVWTGERETGRRR